jgi:hypothetical protein
VNGADLTSVVPIEDMKGDNDEETFGLKQMFGEGRGLLSAFARCQRIEGSYFGFGYAGVRAVSFQNQSGPYGYRRLALGSCG